MSSLASPLLLGRVGLLLTVSFAVLPCACGADAVCTEERKRAQRDRDARRARRRGGSQPDEPDEPEAKPMSEEEKQFMQEYDTAIAEQVCCSSHCDSSSALGLHLTRVALFSVCRTSCWMRSARAWRSSNSWAST